MFFFPTRSRVSVLASTQEYTDVLDNGPWRRPGREFALEAVGILGDLLAVYRVGFVCRSQRTRAAHAAVPLGVYAGGFHANRGAVGQSLALSKPLGEHPKAVLGEAVNRVRQPIESLFSWVNEKTGTNTPGSA